MDDQLSLINIDNLLIQLAFQTRELTQKRYGLNQQIKICRADILDRKCDTKTTQSNIQNLEKEITMKQNTVRHDRANAKSMKASHGLLLLYEKTMKAELESREVSQDQDVEVYEERIASYRNVFQEHKKHYCQNHLAKKLLALQTEKEETESRLGACEDQITTNQKELDNLVGQTVESLSTVEPTDGISGERAITEPEKQFNHHHHQLEKDMNCSPIDISSLHLTQTEDGHKTSGEAPPADDILETPSCPPAPEEEEEEEPSQEMWSYQQLHEQRQQSAQMPAEDQNQDQERGPEEQQEEQRSTMSGLEEVMEEEMEEERGGGGGRVSAAVDEELQAPSFTDEEDTDGVAAFPMSSPLFRTKPQSTPARMKATPSTPTFSLTCSPSSSPCEENPEGKSPAFLFSMNSESGTPSFPEFGFDMDSTQEENSPFKFTSSYFSDKKTSESKSSSGAGFLFDQAEQCEEEFPFSFASKSPQTAGGDQQKTSGDEFPFSFNFGKF